MTNVLYIGNALSSKGKTVSTIDVLGRNLQDFCNVSITSRKRNKVIRLLDMLFTIYKMRKATDVVLIDTYSTTNFYYALLGSQLCRYFKLPYIPILHGGQLENRLKNHPRKSSLLFKYAQHLVAPSAFLKQVFSSYGYNKVIHIPNSIELKNYNYLEKRDMKSIKLLWVRSFSKIYNPSMAQKVMELLISLGNKTQLTMVGPENDGSLSECKQMAKEKGLEITFTGLLSKAQWTELSKQHNIFINTTNIDNTPVSVIEAMALGLPIVSTNVGGLSYLLSDKITGLLVPPNDVDAMAKAILSLKRDNILRRSLIRNARNGAEHFDWNVIKTKWQVLLS